MHLVIVLSERLLLFIYIKYCYVIEDNALRRIYIGLERLLKVYGHIKNKKNLIKS